MSEQVSTQPIAPLKGDESVPGQKFVCMSFISADGRNKHQTRAFKVKQSFETEDEAKRCCKYFQDNDTHFDVYVAKVGEWIPFPESPEVVENIEYENELLTEIVKSKREASEKADIDWESQFLNAREKIIYEGSAKGQEERSKKMESAQSLLFKIHQLEKIIQLRNTEISHIQNFYKKNYPDHSGEELNFPDFSPEPIRFESYTSDQEAPASSSSGSSSKE